jgi:hypothetical protein
VDGEKWWVATRCVCAVSESQTKATKGNDAHQHAFGRHLFDEVPHTQFAVLHQDVDALALRVLSVILSKMRLEYSGVEE